MKVILEVYVDFENVFDIDDKEEREWFEETILKDHESIFIHSNEIGDSLGEVTKVKVTGYIN
jgi:hypothetical protein